MVVGVGQIALVSVTGLMAKYYSGILALLDNRKDLALVENNIKCSKSKGKTTRMYKTGSKVIIHSVGVETWLPD